MRTWIKTQAQAVRLQKRLAAIWTGSSIRADWTAKARHYARLWTRMGVKTQARLSRRAALLKAAAIESSRNAARSGLAHHAAAGLARTRMVTRSLLRRLKAQTIWTARAIKAGWKKQARLASVQLARTRHSAAVLERRATEHVIRFGPRIGHFLAQHTPARTGSSQKTRALIVRPNTALAHIAPDHNFAPAPRSA